MLSHGRKSMEKIVYLEKQQEIVIVRPEDRESRIDNAVRWINRKVANTVHFGLIQIQRDITKIQ